MHAWRLRISAVVTMIALTAASACSFGGGGRDFRIDADNIGEFAWDGTLAQAVDTFGEPESREGTVTLCTIRWPEDGIAMETKVNSYVHREPCVAGAVNSRTTVSDERWQTTEGLRIGHTLERLQELYPDAQQAVEEDTWVLATRPFVGIDFPSFEAKLQNGTVVSFTVYGPRQLQ
jgi:hypothetical protein